MRMVTFKNHSITADKTDKEKFITFTQARDKHSKYLDKQRIKKTIDDKISLAFYNNTEEDGGGEGEKTNIKIAFQMEEKVIALDTGNFETKRPRNMSNKAIKE
jgi:hypothetical protein